MLHLAEIRGSEVRPSLIDRRYKSRAMVSPEHKEARAHPSAQPRSKREVFHVERLRRSCRLLFVSSRSQGDVFECSVASTLAASLPHSVELVGLSVGRLPSRPNAKQDGADEAGLSGSDRSIPQYLRRFCISLGSGRWALLQLVYYSEEEAS